MKNWNVFYNIIFTYLFIYLLYRYDVWFGNTRGNKYSMKHTRFDPSERRFWEYSMDEMALYDLPDTIDVCIIRF
jgi:hypothetical protein